MIRSPEQLLRVSVEGGDPEHLADGILGLVAGKNELYFIRQTAEPPAAKGLNLYVSDLRAGAQRLVANVGFLPSAMRLSADGSTVYMERQDPTQGSIVSVSGWR